MNIDDVQKEMDIVLGIIMNTVENLLDKKMKLCRAHQQLELLKKEEDIMYNYELCFIGYHAEGPDTYFEPETSWQIRTNKTYEEMTTYVNNLNRHYQSKYNNQSFFTFNQIDVLDECPSFTKIECDLKEL